MSEISQNVGNGNTTNSNRNDVGQEIGGGVGEKKVDFLEVIFTNIGGTFGKYQISNFILFCLPFALSGSFGLSYVFTALNVDYRCTIPECESLRRPNYEPDWLSNAVPYLNGKPSKCYRYANSTLSNFPNDETCDIKFDHEKRIQCNEFVYRTDEVSILNDLHLECNDDQWRLATIGTANNLGRLIFMPFMGMLSDYFGRRTILIVGVFGSATFGYLRSFAPNYMTFVAFEFLDAGIGSVTYSSSFILAMEWVNLKHRVLLSCLMTATYPFGQIFLGITARTVKNYRHLLRIIYAPGFLIVLYVWIVPESIRWLMVNRKKDRILSILKRAQKVNGIKIPPNIIVQLNDEIDGHSTPTNGTGSQRMASKFQQFRQIVKKPKFLIRFLICAFAWFVNAFVSYGISLTSTAFAGDKYINFIIIATAGIPAMLIVYFLLDSWGRRWTNSIALLIGGISIIASKSLPVDLNGLSIAFFFVGKCFTTVAFSSLYVYTGEMWPTNIRLSVMSFCSTVGRAGAALAPLTPLLGQYLEIAPYLAFGIMALIASVLILNLPETLHRKLPDTLSEAEEIGMKPCHSTATAYTDAS